MTWKERDTCAGVSFFGPITLLRAYWSLLIGRELSLKEVREELPAIIRLQEET